MGRAIRLLWRAALLRCPQCGHGGLFRHWFALRDTCPSCGFWLKREEGFYTGAWALNLVAAELLFVGGLVVWCVVTWPTPPWPTIQIASVVGVALAPLVFWPHSRTLWLALCFCLDFLEPRKGAPEARSSEQPDPRGAD